MKSIITFSAFIIVAFILLLFVSLSKSSSIDPKYYGPPRQDSGTHATVKPN